jgi:hypothetical protein
MPRQFAVRRFRVASEYPDLAPVYEVNRPAIFEATRGSSEALHKAGVRHVLVGGLAVGAWGYPRWSKDVDFLVGDEAFILHPGGFVTFAPGVPISFAGVEVDSLSIGPDEPFLIEALENPITVDGIPVISVEALVYLKLKSPRDKDRVDVIELVKAGIDSKSVLAWLSQRSPAMAKKFKDAMRKADKEQRDE